DLFTCVCCLWGTDCSPGPFRHAAAQQTTSETATLLNRKSIAPGQLPDLHSVSREDRDQYTLPLAVVSDVGRAGHAGNHLHFLSGLVARHGRVAPARDEHPTPGHLDAVEPTRALGDHARRLVARLPRQHR